MKKSAGSNSGVFSPVGAGGYQDVSRSRTGDSPLIQQVGPDFPRLSRDLNRVVLKIQHQSDSGDCPMHSDESRRSSRAYAHEISESRRGSRAYEVTHRSSSAEIHGSGPSGHRLLSARNSNPETQYMSLPRRLSSAQAKSNSTKVDRRQSFQDFKTFRDKFTGPLDFKSTLRSSSSGGAPSRQRDYGAEQGKHSGRKSRQTSEPRDYEERRGSGYLIESDFDFRSPPSTRDNSRERRSRFGDYDPGARDYYASDVSGGPRRGQGQSGRQQQQSSDRKYQYGYQDLKNQVQSPTSPGIKINVMSPVGSRHDPLSPRRVEFADEVFNFSQGKGTPATSRPGSRCESPTPKGILRHTTSDPSQRGGQRSNTVELASVESRSSKAKEAVRSNTTDLSFCQSDNNLKNAHALLRPTSLIIPDNDNSLANGKNSQPLVKILLSDEHNDSDDTLIEEKHELEESKEKPAVSVDDKDQVGKRKVPPPLADWNRSQSFPPPGASKNTDQGLMPSNLRKSSDPLDSSHASLLSGAMTEYPSNDDLDLIQDDNQSLRVRVGDLEKQVHDNNDEIKCLRATLAECLRKIGDIESVIRHSEQRHQRRRDMSAEPAKSNRKAHVSSSIYGSQDFSNRATFEIHNPPQRGTYAPRQR